MKRFIFFFALLVLSANQACTQVPEMRPAIQNPAFDRQLVDLLSFTIPLLGVDVLYKNLHQYQILDAREREEYEVSHIPGAQYIGYNYFDESLLKGLDKNSPTVVYCSVGYRSEKIAERLRKMGFTKVYNLYGSLFEWANKGYPLENAKGQKTRRIHTYNQSWSQWVNRKGLIKVW